MPQGSILGPLLLVSTVLDSTLYSNVVSFIITRIQASVQLHFLVISQCTLKLRLVYLCINVPMYVYIFVCVNRVCKEKIL